MADTLIPQYLNLDFNTMKARLNDLLRTNPVFRDYDYEGNNITILTELVCYLGALQTYYLNKIAKNQYMETADIYETVHTLSRLRGYNPQGMISNRTILSLAVSGADFVQGDVLYIPAWKSIESPSLIDVDGNTIKYSTVDYITETIPVTASFPYTLTSDINIRQGNILSLVYSGTDLIDNKINLPLFDFDYDDDISNTVPSVEVVVNDILWSRVPDFYSEISGLETIDTVYMFRYDKYERYIIEFASFRDVPVATDNIYIKVLKTLGADGGAGSATITLPETEFIYNQTQVKWCNNEQITVTNLLASTGGASPETIDEVKQNSESSLGVQRRCVTKNDYVDFLQERSDVIVANVWGEQEVAPSGSIYEYNKVRVSVIPDSWGSGTITYTTPSAGIITPTAWVTTYRDLIASYLEPRKMLNAYEAYIVPELVYFTYRIGYKAKRTYDATLVALDILAKLEYYFQAQNRSFNENISHTNVVDYIMDTTKVSATNDFPYTAGIQNLIIRDIHIINKTLVDYNINGNYPMYAVPISSYTGNNNMLNNIILGFNQFPALYSTGCVLALEL